MLSEKKILSGFPGLDQKLNSIRAGDNIVFRVLDLEFFRFFAKSFVEQAKLADRPVHYIRFGSHKSMLKDLDNVIVHKMDPSVGFESFTVDLYKIIMDTKREAFFIFDNISILGEYWNTDLMLGNFFQVTCPFLTEMEDVAIFPLRRGSHSYDCIDQIRQSVQIFLDIVYSQSSYYLTPLKVQDRYNGEMFLTHRLDADMSFVPLTYSTSLAKYYRAVNESGPGEQLQDAWDRFFLEVQMNYANRINTKHYHKKMCSMLMTENPRMQDLILNHFKTRDYLSLHSRIIGTGKIGGKACGMLTARKIIQDHCPEVAAHFEPHDSYYIGSDIYYTFIIYNQFWNLWLDHHADMEDMELAQQIGQRIMEGEFPPTIRIQFKRLLDYYGTSPIIVRSSSFLEDGFGNAFAGKYESVFCVGGNTMEERLNQFEQAIRIVYASTVSPSALEYRRRRNLLDSDEQMALLVQRVSGSRLDHYYFPMAAGVGYSYNNYPWSSQLDPNAGMLRLVAGLGTRAVDRTPGDYPRLVSLDKPTFQTHSSLKDRHKFSQHYMDVLDTEKKALVSKRVEELYPHILPWQKVLLYSHDTEAEQMLRSRGQYRPVLFADCRQLLSNQKIITCMQEMLLKLQEVYETPVDIEYTINISDSGEFWINLLQCRPLQSSKKGNITLPTIPKEDTYLNVVKNTMGTSRNIDVGLIVVVDPYAYYTLNHAKKPDVARAIGKINHHFMDQPYQKILITPGRIGTSSPELGVPVTFAEISDFNMIAEVAYSKVGYMPELSFGSHMFQDLVEAEILYVAIMENTDTRIYDPAFLSQFEEVGHTLLDEDMASIISVYRVHDIFLAYDAHKQEILCGKKGER